MVSPTKTIKNDFSGHQLSKNIVKNGQAFDEAIFHPPPSSWQQIQMEPSWGLKQF